MGTLNEFWTFLQSPASASSTVAFIWGVLVALLLVLLVRVWTWVRQRRKEQGFIIPSENGDLKMTGNAIKEFVSRVVSMYGEASMKGLKIKTASSGALHLQIGLAVVSGTAVVPLVHKLRDQLQKEARTGLGIEEDMRIDITVKSLSAEKRRTPQENRQ